MVYVVYDWSTRQVMGVFSRSEFAVGTIRKTYSKAGGIEAISIPKGAGRHAVSAWAASDRDFVVYGFEALNGVDHF